MSKHPVREALRQAIQKVWDLMEEKAHGVVRPFDEDDTKAALALSTAVLRAIPRGITPAEEEAIQKLFQAWIEARRNTP